MIKTVKHYLTASKYDWQHEWEFAWCDYKYEPTPESKQTRIVIREQDFDLEIPDDFDPRPAMIAALEAQQKKATADYQALMTVLDGKIQQLRCIEMKPDLTYNETRGE